MTLAAGLESLFQTGTDTWGISRDGARQAIHLHLQIRKLCHRIALACHGYFHVIHSGSDVGTPEKLLKGFDIYAGELGAHSMPQTMGADLSGTI